MQGAEFFEEVAALTKLYCEHFSNILTFPDEIFTCLSEITYKRED